MLSTEAHASIPQKKEYAIPDFLQKNPPQLFEAREQFDKALNDLDKNQLTDEQIDQMVDYPLQEYLLFAKAKATLHKKQQQSINKLLSQYPNSHLSSSLRRKWLNYLKKKQLNFLFQMFYQPGISTEISCYHFDLKQQDSSLTMDDYTQIRKLWMVGKSQPKACDKIFAALVKSKYLNQEHVWQRIEMAMLKGNPGLAKYLKRFLPKSQQVYVQKWIRLRGYPSDALWHKTFSTYDKFETKIAVYALKRLAWKRTDLAIKGYNKLTAKFTFDHKAHQEIIQSIASALVYQNSPKAAEYLEKVKYPIYVGSLQQKMIVHPLRNGQWQTVLNRIQQLPLEQQQSNQWRYWQARALEKTGFEHKAKEIYQQIATERDYYSFLASMRIQKPIQLNHSEAIVTTDDFNSLASFPSIIKARELLHHDKKHEARREWIAARKHMTNKQKKALAIVADSWGWHEQSIISFAQAQYWDDLNRRFPLPYEDIQTESNRHEIDPAWSYAIARQESAFMDDATSGSGARGLMQLMPKTAKYIAKKYQLKSPKRHELYQTDTNIQLGTGYLKYLLNKTQNNPIIATAAYNAGPNRVAKWIPEDAMPTDIWVESIPFKETRKYVKNVIAYQAIYATHLGRDSKLIDIVVDKKIKSLADVKN